MLGALAFAPWARAASAVPPPACRDLLAGFRRMHLDGRAYRVDATVIFCGVPLLTRRDAGGAYVIAETGVRAEATALGLQFAAGSRPDRAAGLNRFGAIEEAVVESGGSRESVSFGLITGTSEENFAEARKAIRERAGAVTVTFMKSHSHASETKVWTHHAGLPAGASWDSSSQALRDLAAEQTGAAPRIASGQGQSFLSAMRQAGASASPVERQPFFHAGKQYTLHTRRASSDAQQVDGTILNATGGKSAEFRVWYAAGDTSGIPMRMEYRAKSYLKLTFHAIGEPMASSLFPA